MEKHKFSKYRPECGQWIWLQGETRPVQVSLWRRNMCWKNYHQCVELNDDHVWTPCVSPFSVETDDGLMHDRVHEDLSSTRGARTVRTERGEGG